MSVVQLSGKGAAAFVRSLCGAEIEAGSPRFARFRFEGEDLDEGIVCRLAPDRFELHLHGSPVLVERLARALPATSQVASPATPTSRSLEARALEDLARAPAEAAARILLDQAEGALARELRSLVAADRASRERRIDALLARARTARFALRPAEIVLAGPVNSGKSTLFNALLGETRAIVDATPGTTRDVLRERALFGTWPVWLVDTAGERELVPGRDDVELEGQSSGLRARVHADLVLRLASVADGEPSIPPGARTVALRTFADLGADLGADPGADLGADLGADGLRAEGAISALRDPAGARARIAEIFRTSFDLPEDAWTSGDGVPFRDEIAAEIAALRHVEDATLARRVEAIVRGEPRNGDLGTRALGDAFARPESPA